jgi:hypothetical protein
MRVFMLLARGVSVWQHGLLSIAPWFSMQHAEGGVLAPPVMPVLQPSGPSKPWHTEPDVQAIRQEVLSQM